MTDIPAEKGNDCGKFYSEQERRWKLSHVKKLLLFYCEG